jgi:hypothetical protein
MSKLILPTLLAYVGETASQQSQATPDDLPRIQLLLRDEVDNTKGAVDKYTT